MLSRIELNQPDSLSRLYPATDLPVETTATGIRQARSKSRPTVTASPLPYQEAVRMLSLRAKKRLTESEAPVEILPPAFDFLMPDAQKKRQANGLFCKADVKAPAKALEDYTPSLSKLEDMQSIWKKGKGKFSQDEEFAALPALEVYQDQVQQIKVSIEKARSRDGSKPGQVGPEEARARVAALKYIKNANGELGKVQVELIKQLNYTRAAFLTELRKELKENSPVVGLLGDADSPPDSDMKTEDFVKDIKDRKDFRFLFNNRIQDDLLDFCMKKRTDATSAQRLATRLEALQKKYKPLFAQYESLTAKLETIQNTIQDPKLLTVQNEKGEALPYQFVNLSPHADDMRLVTYKKADKAYVPQAVAEEDGSFTPVDKLKNEKWKQVLADSRFTYPGNDFTGYRSVFAQLPALADAFTKYSKANISLYRANLYAFRRGAAYADTAEAYKTTIRDAAKDAPIITHFGNCLADFFGLAAYTGGWGPMGYCKEVDDTVKQFKTIADDGAKEIYAKRETMNKNLSKILQRTDTLLDTMIRKSLENVREYENPKGDGLDL